MNVTDSNHHSVRSPRHASLRGKVVVIIGATSGLGLETAKQLATEGAEIVMVSRDQTSGEQARRRSLTSRPADRPY